MVTTRGVWMEMGEIGVLPPSEVVEDEGAQVPRHYGCPHAHGVDAAAHVRILCSVQLDLR